MSKYIERNRQTDRGEERHREIKRLIDRQTFFKSKIGDAQYQVKIMVSTFQPSSTGDTEAKHSLFSQPYYFI